MSTNKAETAFSELYSAYAAGCLDPAFALLVETQAALRADVKRDIQISELIAATQFEAAEPAEMDDGAVDRAFEAIDAVNGASRPAPAVLNGVSEALEELLDLPDPLKESALVAAGKSGWKFSGPGLRRLSLNVSDTAETELYRIEPGAVVPRHSHEGTEFTLVVSGGFTDETGTFGPGDLSVKGPADTHQPVADDDGPCLVLAVRDGGLRFQGVIGIVQRLMG
ncbi:MAG: cupin domain-containing protein [Pseudomonadota bacterium]